MPPDLMVRLAERLLAADEQNEASYRAAAHLCYYAVYHLVARYFGLDPSDYAAARHEIIREMLRKTLPGPGVPQYVILARRHCCPGFFGGRLVHGRHSQGFGPKSKSPNKILRSAAPFLRSAFSRILEPLDRRVANRIVDEHQGNRGVGRGDRAWTCRRHLKTMIFAHLAGLTSLRDMVEALAAHPGGLYHVGLRPPKRATLADAWARRPVAVFRDIALNLIREMVGGARGEGRELIRLIDGSPIPIRDGRFAWAESDSRCRGLKLHLVYDPRAVQPVHFAFEGVKTSELTIAGQFDIEPGATYVFDKGYTDYGWRRDIVATGAVFVTRLKSNAHRRDIRPGAPEGESILKDQKLKIGHKKPWGGATNLLYDTELREVVVAREGKSPLHLITNDHNRTAKEIVDLYK